MNRLDSVCISVANDIAEVEQHIEDFGEWDFINEQLGVEAVSFKTVLGYGMSSITLHLENADYVLSVTFDGSASAFIECHSDSEYACHDVYAVSLENNVFELIDSQR